MIRLILRWLLIGGALILIGNLVSGISIADYKTALLFALLLSILNILIRPVLFLLTLPVNILTLGLFSFVLNGIVFALAAYLISGVEVANIFSAIIGALLISIVGSFIDHFVLRKDE